MGTLLPSKCGVRPFIGQVSVAERETKNASYSHSGHFCYIWLSRPRAEAEMVHRMYAASLQEMAEAAARQRQEEEAELRQRLLVISPAGAADQV